MMRYFGSTHNQTAACTKCASIDDRGPASDVGLRCNDALLRVVRRQVNLCCRRFFTALKDRFQNGVIDRPMI